MRTAIIAETAKLGLIAFLPPPVPFGSKRWQHSSRRGRDPPAPPFGCR
jgi:hypothetical protein